MECSLLVLFQKDIEAVSFFSLKKSHQGCAAAFPSIQNQFECNELARK